MTVINPSSISGITSITMPSGDGNVLTIHSNDGTERFRIDSSGNVKVGTAATISPDGDLFVTGVCTATTLAGSGANLTNLPAANVTGTLPAISGANLTSLTAGNLTGALPAISGANLTGIGGTDFIHAEQINTTGIVTATSFAPTVGQLSHRNLVINGAMMVAERGTSSAGGEGYKTVDRFQYYKSGTNETPNQAQVDVAAGTTPYTLGFRKAYQVENGNQSSAGGSDLVFIETNLEAQDIANSGWNYLSSSSYITLSFWVKSSVAQNFYGYLLTVDGTAYKYPFETGSLSADTWTKVTKTIPGNSNLQFDNDSNKGLGIVWWPFLGDSYTDSGVSLNTWATWSTSTRTPDATNTWYLINDATFQITGVQLEVGPVATPFEHRKLSEELQACRRYYQRHAAYGDHYMFGIARAESNTARSGITVPVPMRAAPTVTCNGSRTFREGYVSESTSTPSIYASSAHVTTSPIYTIDFGGHNLDHNYMYALMSKTTSTNALELDAEI